MDQQFLLLAAAPKKARKLFFADPFIHHSVRQFLDLPVPSRIEDLEKDEIPGLVESCFVSHFKRGGPTFYIKARGEVDLAYVREGRFWPVEVKWTRDLRPEELQQVAKYPNGLIAARTRRAASILSVPVLPAPVVLLRAAAD